MRIGIDARFLTHPQVGGFKTCTENLTRGISQFDDTNSYVIYLDRPDLDGSLPHADNFTYRVVDGTLPVIGMPVREQIRLRRCFADDRLDVIHFLCNTAPIFVREKFIVTLHDTIQVMRMYSFQSVTTRCKTSQ